MAEDLSIIVKSPSSLEVQDDDVPRSTNGTVDNALVESILQELNGRVDREQILQAIQEVKIKYLDATVDTFIPIFVRREVIELLK